MHLTWSLINLTPDLTALYIRIREQIREKGVDLVKRILSNAFDMEFDQSYARLDHALYRFFYKRNKSERKG